MKSFFPVASLESDEKIDISLLKRCWRGFLSFDGGLSKLNISLFLLQNETGTHLNDSTFLLFL